MKKLLSVLLVVLMLVGMLPMNAIHTHAAETTETLSIYGSTGTMSGTSSISWTSNGVTFTNYKTSSSTAIRTSDTSYYRVYANSEVEVIAPGNITKIVITSTGSSYNTPWVNSAGTIGTASNSGNVITVVPTTPAKTLKFSATAQVRLSSIEITYASADSGETYTVSFSVPEGVSSVADMECTGSGITLPTAGVPTGDYIYTFAGWVAQTVDNATEAPDIYEAGDTFTASEDTTLYALYTYCVAGEGTGETTWDLVKDAAALATGDRIVIVASGYAYALSTTQNSNNRGQASVTKSGDTVTFGSDVQVLELTEGKVADTFGLYTGTGYLNAASSSSNYLRTETTLSNNSSWKIESTSSGVATIKAQGTYTRNWLRYNTSSKIFSCYSSGQADVAIYKENSGAASTTYYTTEISSAPAECTHENTTTTTVNATCTENGSVTVTCDDCGVTVSTTEIPKLDHNYGTGVVTAPTCIAEGYTTYTCSACGHSYTDNKTEPTGEHTYVDGICSVCGAEEPNTGATEWQLVTDASTLAAGDKIIIVAEGAEFALGAEQANNNRPQAAVVKNDEVVTFDDTLVQVITLEAGNVSGTFAFSTDEGYLYAASSGSNYLRSKATLDDNGSWLITIADDGVATIKAQGSNTRNWLRYNSTNSIFSCYASGQGDVLIYKETIVCEHEKVVDVAEVPATCTTVGYTAGKQCAECGAYTEGHEEIAALGHSYGEGVVTTAPTCTDAGVKTFTCTACGDTKTETVAATGHLNTTETKVDATCTVAGSVTVTCDDCGAVISSTTIPAGHSWGEGKVTTEATCEEPGVMTYTCSVCKETKTEEIAALGHSWDEGEVTTKATCETAGVKTFTCQNDPGHTKTEEIAPLGHSYNSEGICENCGAEVSHYELVTDYTKILAGGEFVLAIKSGDTFYALNNDATSNPTTFDLTDDLTGEGADMMVIWSEDIPVWQVDYYPYRTNCFSLYSSEQKEYLAATDESSFASSSSAWAWTFIDSNSSEESDGDGIYAVEQSDGSVAFVVASASIIDRAISLRNSSQFANYSVRDPRNREVYFFKMVKSGTTEHTVTFVENGQAVSTVGVDVDDNVIELPEYSGTTNMPNGYTDFLGWVTLPHTESLIAPTTIYGAGDTFYVTEDTKLYALYTREDTNAEGQAMSYQLVTDNNQLVQDRMYIIVGYNEKTDTYYAMSKDQLSGDRGASVVVPDSNGVITFTPADNVAVLKLTQGYEIGSFAFLDVAMNKFLYCASTNSENALKSEAELSADSSFAITINNDENGIYSIMIAKSTDTNRTNLAYNTVSDDADTFLFSCYNPNVTSVNLQQTFLYVGVPNTTVATYYTTGLCDHQWVETEKVAATCEHAGYTIETCSVCGEVRVTDTKAHGHTVGSTTVTTNPTCTTTGVATSYCTACNKEFTEILPVIPHTEVVDDAVAASCTETGLTEGKHCSVCDTVLVPQQVAPALGHDFDAAKGTVDDTGNYPVVVYPCSRCDETHIAAELRFQNASLTLENNIVINFKTSDKVAGDSTYGGFTNLRAVFTYGHRTDTTGDNAITAEGVLQDDGRYNLACRRVTPSQIGDKITAFLYGTYGDEEYSYTMTYSAAQYCYDTLKITNNAKLKTLLVDLLYFCDAAREYTTYQGVDEAYEYYGSVTKNLSQDQKDFRTTAEPTCESVMGVSEGEYAVTWQSASLIIGDTTSIQFTVNMGDALLTKDMIRVTVGGATYTDVDCRQVGNVWQIRVFGLAAHQMRKTVQVTLYSGDVAISQTVSYSIESYVARNMQNSNTKLVDMLIAMMKYGDAAVAYKG